MKNKFFILLVPIVLLFSMASSCQKEQTGGTMDFLLSVSAGPLEVEEGQSIKSLIYKGRGPLKSDVILLKGIKGSSQNYEYPIDELTGSYFTFKIGQGFQSGTYAFNIKRGDATKFITNVEYNLKAAELPDGTTIDEGTTVYGVVSCSGTGVQGVMVSDGYEVALTDANGLYQLKSAKKNAYVYITVPSGYEVSCEGSQAIFYDYLTKGASTAEQHDFNIYEAGDQTVHTAFLLGDMHLAGGKNSDRTQFARFTSELNSYVAAHSGEKMYAFTLGDMTWDLYWYSKNYCFDQYVSDMNAVKNLPVFNTIGNHDNDMKTSVDGSKSGWDAVDWDTAARFRKDLGPNYYSVNIGKIHYLVVDNIYCTNTTGGEGEDRHYAEKVSDDNLAWIRKDLAYVDKSTPIVVLMHAPMYDQSGNYNLANASVLASCFSGFSDVTFVTGHTHKMWSIKSNPALKEHNSGAVCGTWWWAGRYEPDLNLAQDGAPAGYRVMAVDGVKHTSYFKGTGFRQECQFRTYDRNQIAIDNPNMASYGNYNVSSTANQVLVNVWDYDTDWKVEVFENGKSLKVTRSTLYDPLFLQVYICNRYPSLSSDISFPPFKTNHIFCATASSSTSTLLVKVTDDEGRVYTETMNRPKAFTLDSYKQ